jgi:hypothetical protein
MTLIAAATVGLSAATPNPNAWRSNGLRHVPRGADRLRRDVFMFPWIDGFPLLCVMLAPVIVLGSFLTSRPQYAGVGLGLLIFFSTGSVPDNLTVYNPYTFINDYIAMVMGMLVCAAAGAIIAAQQPLVVAPPGAGPARQVVYAISGKLKGLARVSKAAPATCCTRPMAWRPASRRCSEPAALDVRGAGSRPRDHRVAQGTGVLPVHPAMPNRSRGARRSA